MLAFTSMLVAPAAKAGMKVPLNVEDYDREEFMHFHVYELMQIGRPLPHPAAHWDNAEVIAALSEDEVKQVTYTDLLAKGYV